MKSLDEVKATLKSNRDNLFKRYPIKSLAIFGSFARNEVSVDSDLDVLVEFDDKIGARFIDLAYDLEELFEIKVDLVSKNGVKERYMRSIKEDLIYV